MIPNTKKRDENEKLAEGIIFFQPSIGGFSFG
jgi:hypothetical protein